MVVGDGDIVGDGEIPGSGSDPSGGSDPSFGSGRGGTSGTSFSDGSASRSQGGCTAARVTTLSSSASTNIVAASIALLALAGLRRRKNQLS